MIDWVKAVIPWTHKEEVKEGQVTKTKADGEIEWSINTRQPIAGSFDSKIHIHSDRKSWDPAIQQFRYIVFDGNPVKFFQGHNLWGTNDLIGLMSEMVLSLSNIIDRPINDIDWYLITNGLYDIKRIDSTIMLDLGNLKSVKSFIYSAERLAHMRHRGQGVMKGGTLYFGKNSRRESLKMYAKGEEINAKGHELPIELASLPSLQTWADGKLRIESTLRAMELKDIDLHKASVWDENTPIEVVQNALSRIDMSEQHTITPEALDGLPSHLRAPYLLWKQGNDLKAIYSRMTFYRYRKQLKEKANIDIAIKQPKTNKDKEPTNVIEFRRVLSPTPCFQVPDWAIGTDLYFEPRAKISR